MMTEIIRVLTARAEEKLGADRTAELRPEIEQMAADLQKLQATVVVFEDEP